MIRGGPSIKTYSILNDKRHIVAKDTDGQVAVFDVLKAAKVEDCGNADYDQIVKDRQQVGGKPGNEQREFIFSLFLL